MLYDVAEVPGYVFLCSILSSHVNSDLFLLIATIFLQDSGDNTVSYEDRSLRFFPPAPRVPRIPSVVSGDSTLMDNTEDSFQDLLNTSHQQFNILCSADKDGSVCFSIFGIFPIGKVVSNSLTFGNITVLNMKLAYH